MGAVKPPRKKTKPKWKPGTRVPAPTYPGGVAFGAIALVASEGSGKTIFARPKHPELADMEYRSPRFSGATYDPAKDHVRLTKNLQRVYDLMKGGEWWTIPELAEYLEPTGPMAQTGIGARLRDLRQPRFGGHTVETRRRNGSGGLWEYRLVLAC